MAAFTRHRQARLEANPETRQSLRDGAREHAQYQQALPPQPTAPTWQEAHRPTLEELEAVCGEAPFPAGDYPVTLAEVVGRVERAEARIEELEARLSGRGAMGHAGRAAWERGAGGWLP